MAKNYRTSNYGLNKNSKGIVYKYADGTTLELTFEKISADDPNFTRDDFEKFKNLSDELYHEEAILNWTEENYTKCSIDQNLNLDWLATDTLEDELFSRISTIEKRAKIRTAVSNELTKLQRRRFILHALKNMTEREIAELEGVDRRAVHDSIEAARKKFKKFLKNF